jgi:hypothetical protein
MLRGPVFQGQQLITSRLSIWQFLGRDSSLSFFIINGSEKDNLSEIKSASHNTLPQNILGRGIYGAVQHRLHPQW